MSRKRIGELSSAKQAQLKLRLTPTVDKRLATLSALTGESKTGIAGTAMLMGLRLLENSIMGPELAASSLEELTAQLKAQIEADVDLFEREAIERDALHNSQHDPELVLEQ